MWKSDDLVNLGDSWDVPLEDWPTVDPVEPPAPTDNQTDPWLGDYNEDTGSYAGDGTLPDNGTTVEPVAPPPDNQTTNSTTDPYLGAYDPKTNTYAGVPKSVWDTISSGAKDLFTSAAKKLFKYDPNKSWSDNLINAITSPGGLGTIGAIAGLADKRPAYGGGIAQAYAGPAQQLTRTIQQGQNGPIAKHTQAPVTTAAHGGIMHAYAYAGGGPVAMEDGAFVMTKRAVDGAGGPRGIQQLVPGARMIRGPGNGTSDSIPAFIQGQHGRAPALVSNGEAYIPRQAVQQAGGSRRMYELMNKLQRRA